MLEAIDFADEVFFGEELAVEIGVHAALLMPTVEMREFDVEHRGLQSVEAEVAPNAGVEVLRLHAVIAELAGDVGIFRVARDDHAAIAETAEVLGGEE